MKHQVLWGIHFLCAADFDWQEQRKTRGKWTREKKVTRLFSLSKGFLLGRKCNNILHFCKKTTTMVLGFMRYPFFKIRRFFFFSEASQKVNKLPNSVRPEKLPISHLPLFALIQWIHLRFFSLPFWGHGHFSDSDLFPNFFSEEEIRPRRNS